MKTLRLRLAGGLIVMAIWVMPRGPARRLLLDHIDAWFRRAWVALGGRSRDVRTYRVTKKYRSGEEQG